MTHTKKSPESNSIRAVCNQTENPLIIVATSGTSGDILPFLTLSQGLLERGHRVLMLVPRFHEAIILTSGVPYQTFGSIDEWHSLLNDPDLWDDRKGWGVIWRGLLPHLGIVRQLIEQLSATESCVVLSHPILVPMAALARSVRPNLRIVSACLAPSNMCSSYDMLSAGSLQIPDWMPISWRKILWKLIHRGWIDPVTLPGLNAARSQNGLPTVPHFFEHILMTPNASLGLFPNWYASTQPDWPKPFIESDFVRSPDQKSATLSQEVEQFLLNGTPPIIFTPGTGHRHATQYFDIALKTLERLRQRGIFVTSHKEQLPKSLPSHVMWQAHVPFAALLPRAAAVVHHGGIGTIAESFHSGIPQLIVPFAYDQFDNGFRAKKLGVADVLLAKQMKVGHMHKKLKRLLFSQDVERACCTIEQKMAQRPDPVLFLDLAEAALLGLPIT